jgi:hypothetical protein
MSDPAMDEVERKERLFFARVVLTTKVITWAALLPTLENNACERPLKKGILYRKNALFYRTQNGAKVGDLFMSLIHTAELCGINPFDYFPSLPRRSDPLLSEPSRWMPWIYRATLAESGMAA